MRLQAEQRRDEIERKVIEYQQQMKDIHETLVRLIVEKNIIEFTFSIVKISRSSGIIST